MFLSTPRAKWKQICRISVNPSPWLSNGLRRWVRKRNGGDGLGWHFHCVVMPAGSEENTSSWQLQGDIPRYISIKLLQLDAHSAWYIRESSKNHEHGVTLCLGCNVPVGFRYRNTFNAACTVSAVCICNASSFVNMILPELPWFDLPAEGSRFLAANIVTFHQLQPSPWGTPYQCSECIRSDQPQSQTAWRYLHSSQPRQHQPNSHAYAWPSEE